MHINVLAAPKKKGCRNNNFPCISNGSTNSRLHNNRMARPIARAAIQAFKPKTRSHQLHDFHKETRHS